MFRATALLHTFYPNIVYVPSLAHGLYRVSEEIRKQFGHVNELISSVKRVFLKAPARMRALKEQLPGILLLPEPVLTRWRTWLSAVEYYSTDFSSIKCVVDGFSTDDAVCIRQAQDIPHAEAFEAELADLRTHFTFLADSIRKLQTYGELSHRSTEVVTENATANQ